jgi:GntR family transcriptional regulator / MocR family aminotransferase
MREWRCKSLQSLRGLHLVVWLNDIPGNKESQIADRARRAGIGIYPISPLYADATEGSRYRNAGLVMGYAALDERSIRRGVAALSEVLDER